MHETNQSVLNTRTNIAKAIEVFINRYPYGIRPEDLEKHMGDVENLIGMLNVLPRKQNQSLLHL
jgi:hypothetical protein